MNRRSWILASLAAVAAGCGGATEFDAKASYSPESIAQELSFRLRELSGEARKLKKPVGKKATPPKERDLAKSGEAKKEPPANTADAVFEDVARKIHEAPGPRAEFCKKIVEALRKDTSLTPAEQDDLAKRIEAIANE